MTLVDNYQGHANRHSYETDINFAFYFQLGTKKKKTPCTNTFMI